MVASYGLVFGIQYKMPSLQVIAYRKDSVWRRGMQELIECPYCLGFWMGWVTWIASLEINPMVSIHPLPILVGGAIWAIAASGFCYIMDVAIARMGSGTENSYGGPKG